MTGVMPRGKIFLDDETDTFRLYSHSTLYAFRVDERGDLEHLYWGEAIPPQDDLRHMAFTNVQLCFDPGPMNQFDDTFLHELAGMEDEDKILDVYVNARKQNQSNMDLADLAQAVSEATIDGEPIVDEEWARRENAAWRALKMSEKKGEDEEEPLLTEEDLKKYDDAVFGKADPSEPFDASAIAEIHNAQLSNKPTPLRIGHNEFGEGFVPTSATELMVEAVTHSATSKLPTPAPSPLIAMKMHPEEIADMGMAGLPVVGRNTKRLEYSDQGTGDYRRPSFTVAYKDGGTISPLSYKKYSIVPGKLPFKTAQQNEMPQLRGGEDGQTQTLVVEMEDKLTGLCINLIYTVYRDCDALVRRVLVHNPPAVVTPAKEPGSAPITTGGAAVRLDRLMSATMDFHASFSPHLITLTGSWANERHVRVQELKQGRIVSESLRGTSSHQHNPFMAVTTVGEEQMETTGQVWACSLVYSGNFICEAEFSESGRIRINTGINPTMFKWHLAGNESFESPEAVLVYSGNGLEAMTHTFHELYQRFLIPEAWYKTIPPVLINTWESMYFDVSHAKVLDLAKAAAACGVEMIVLDDGWFGGRDDATSSLGDWHENTKKFPEGLPGLVRDVNALGLKFGIWVEPEMVNVNSELYKKNPSWTLNQQGRRFRCEGRFQLVLDFTIQAVREHICGKLEALLSGSNIEYMKWDMNRHLTEVYGNAFAPERQGEVFHRYMLGVYKVLAYVNEKFPHVRIETCSGGGGRFDAGMLYFSPQIWASDNTDVFSRLAIQTGTSLVYPLSCIGAHITEVPNHQTHRLSSLKARFLVALFGTFGLELDVKQLSEWELADLSAYIAKFKELAPIVMYGRFYRLWTPTKATDQQAYSWMSVSRDPRSHIVAVCIVLLSRLEIGRYLPVLRLRGLTEKEMYIVEEIFPNTTARDLSSGKMTHNGPPQYQMGRQYVAMSGACLMRVGLPIRLSYDGDSCAFVVTRKQSALTL